MTGGSTASNFLVEIPSPCSTVLEARPETRFLAVSRTISPLFPMPEFPKGPFPDGPLGIDWICLIS